ncbi:hypothetical protein TNCV_2880611 [Trichonephila clavipes]|nr:hypothetical protein TNCV_2880611 [Trichonephila clavipes]
MWPVISYEFDIPGLTLYLLGNVCQVYGEDAIETKAHGIDGFVNLGKKTQKLLESGMEWTSIIRWRRRCVEQAIRNNPNPTVQELTETFNVHWKMVERRLVNRFYEKVGSLGST